MLTLFIALFASCLIWFYKHVIQLGNTEINVNWRTTPAETARP